VLVVRPLATIACILLVGLPSSCWHLARKDADAAYSEIVSIRRSDPKRALKQVKNAYEDFAKGTEAIAGWRIRLLYADVLLDTHRLKEAETLLQGEPPSGAQFASLRAKLAVSRVRLASKNADWPLAERRYQGAMALPAAAQDPCLRAELLAFNIQNLLDEDRYPDATSRLAEMDSVADACPDQYWQAIRRYLIGVKLFYQFRFEEALDRYNEALAFSRENHLRILVPLLLGNLASCELSLGDTEVALRLLKEADEIYGETGQEYDRSIDRGRRGVIYSRLKQYAKAAAEYKEALRGAKQAGFRPYEVEWLNQLTALNCDTGDLKSAAVFNEQALQRADPPKDVDEYASAQLNAARIARLRGDYAAALGLLQPLGSNASSKSFRWQVQGERAQLLAAMKRPSEARHEFEEAIQTAESARGEVQDVWYRMTFSSQVLDLYRRYVDFLIDHNAADRALQVADSLHARELLEKLHSAEKLEPEIDFAKVARGQGAVILSYWVGGQRSYMWLTTGEGSRMFKLRDTTMLDAQIRKYRREIDDRSDFLRHSESSIALYNELIAPAAAYILQNANVVVIPDGPLADLNFETLVMPGSPARYWMEIVSLRVAPSLTLLHSREPPEVHIGSLLLVGGTKPPQPFAVLPGSQREIEAIERLFASAHPTVLSGDGATPQRFLDADPGRFSLIHLSAHALAVKENPLDSAIIFTPQKQNGESKLYARQLAAMKLSANLVTLSACQGAGARTVPGEGLVGLTWALLSAGAHNVVAGLWDVPDAASAQLMERFYAGLHNREPPGKALREAKMQMRQQAPYYWAAFQLYSR
jgi:CHAT domain-containing protein/predicted negative regulator of RcsB-dependent stress response